ncbi:hypothetical protein C7C46_00240 [Streptomyces tateyamensis]|uniref:Uncharacterized protein n=1 Tax=Streptomyces tateyamensis TaxID=565073 RepID=A0A2V4P195_9ACTN|nr:hypothetical protein [Streptomyces tateyamensis]PYC88473.1 hypothetical protein C7C46_00240 [Streptomyces tateyamensis]
MSARALRLALALHPTGYRREWGEELTATFTESTAGADRWAVARELFDLAGHGLRLRVGLGSAGVAAQLTALVAPFAAVAAAGEALAHLIMLPYLLRQGSNFHWVWSAHPVLGIVQIVGLLLALAAAVAATLGRWTPARVLAPIALLASCTTGLSSLSDILNSRTLLMLLIEHGPQAMWVLFLLAAPRDLLGPPSWRTRLGALAGALVGGVIIQFGFFAGEPAFLREATQYLALTAIAVELALLVAAVPLLLRGWYGPAAAALAGTPLALLVFLTVLEGFVGGARNVAPVLAVLLPVAALGLAHRLGHRIPPSRSSRVR